MNRTDEPVDITSIDGDPIVNTGEDARTRGPNGLTPRGVAVVKTTRVETLEGSGTGVPDPSHVRLVSAAGPPLVGASVAGPHVHR
ncbi:hypothetical protein ACQP1S_01910 [Micromonospora matsumotoense]|uniref:hypothetical protein n=1 Tax=Micromonospora matsumotoense TaxID=121616 RepID=UPI003D8BA8CE